MANYRTSVLELRTKADTLESLNASLKSAVEALVTSEANLGTMWEGEAKEAFHNAFITDRDKMNEFILLIDKYIVALRNIAQKYETTENQNLNTATTRTYG